MNTIWSEENKIIKFDRFVKADMYFKVGKLSGSGCRMIQMQELADDFYNYDYFLSDPNLAVQFISDYPQQFVVALSRYLQTKGKVFLDVEDPRKVASLMMLYGARDIVKQLFLNKEEYQSKQILSKDYASNIMSILQYEEPDRDILTSKVMRTSDTLQSVSHKRLLDAVLFAEQNHIPIKTALIKMRQTNLSESTICSMLQNSYPDCAKIIKETKIRARHLEPVSQYLVKQMAIKEAERIFQDRNIKTIMPEQIDYDVLKEMLDQQSILIVNPDKKEDIEKEQVKYEKEKEK